MTSYYVEPKSYPTYTATPPNTSTAYDGDGLAKGLATPAYVSIDLTGYTADAGDTVTVGGAVLTCVASGAAANQFNAGSDGTLATNLASAIIAATNTVSAAATGWNTPQLRNACFASASGATLTIQTRAGSAVYNSNSSWKVVSSGLAGGSQLDATFANGASGAWGCFFSDYDDGTYWPSAVTQQCYGVIYSSNTASNHAPLAGPCGSISFDTDIVHVRCNGKQLANTYEGFNSGAAAIIYRSAYYLFDDGTEWATGAGYLTIVNRSTAVNYNGLSPLTTKVALVNRSTDWSKGLRLRTSTSGRAACGIVPGNASQEILIEGILFEDVYARCFIGSTNCANSEIVTRRCKWYSTRNAFPTAGGQFWSNSYPNTRWVFEQCVFDFSSYSGANTYLFDTSGGVTAANVSNSILIRNCKLISQSTGHTVCSNYIGGWVQIENCEGFAANTSFGVLAQTVAPAAADIPHSIVIQQGILSSEHFRHEFRTHIVDWDPDGGYPTLDSYLPSGTAWSTRITWSNSANVERHGGFEIYRRSQFVGEASKQTVTLEMLFDNAITPNVSQLGLVVSYIKNSDSSRATELSHVTSLTRHTGTDAIPTSSASWTKAGSYSTWTARKLALALSDDIKQNTTIDVTLMMYKKSPSGITTIFVNPEIGLSA